MPPNNSGKFEANVAAIKLLKQLETEDRAATPDEQKILSRYSGWGWAKEVFSRTNPNWAKQRAELRPLLTDEEWKSAASSSVNAHYTHPAIVSGIWKLIERLGFTGGRVLEPSFGSGLFVGLMPDSLHSQSDIIATELDSLTARMAAKMYPQVDVRNEGFEHAKIPANSMDLATSNVPFGDYTIAGEDYDDLRIHDYFFARGLDKDR